jgi:hypothetical protein
MGGKFTRALLSHQIFYFPHMKYGKYWFHLQFFFIANFHVLGLFIPKKSDAQVRRVNTFHILQTIRKPYDFQISKF